MWNRAQLSSLEEGEEGGKVERGVKQKKHTLSVDIVGNIYLHLLVTLCWKKEIKNLVVTKTDFQPHCLSEFHGCGRKTKKLVTSFILISHKLTHIGHAQD